jgi:hypothetical protein
VNSAGLSASKIALNRSCEGIPADRSRNRLGHAFFFRPNAAIATGENYLLNPQNVKQSLKLQDPLMLFHIDLFGEGHSYIEKGAAEIRSSKYWDITGS